VLNGITPDTYRGLLLSVGSRSGTRPLSPVEVAKGLKVVLDAGTRPKDVAAALHLDGTTMIQRFVRLLSLNPDVQHLIDWGQTGATIAFTAASELARLKSAEDQAVACTAALENELTSGEVKSLVQLKLRSRKALQECVDEIVRLRPTVQRRHVLVGAVTSSELRTRLEALTQLQRDEAFRKALNKQFPGLGEAASRLGADRYTITGDEALFKRLTKDPAGFESVITKAIAAVVEQPA
jgi:hypothetical protein